MSFCLLSMVIVTIMEPVEAKLVGVQVFDGCIEKEAFSRAGISLVEMYNGSEEARAIMESLRH